MEHLLKPQLCPNAPEPVRKEALSWLATKCGTLSSIPIEELGTPSNPHIVGDDDEGRVPLKKRKAMGGSVAKRKWGDMDAFVDCGLLSEEKAWVDLMLLRYVHSAVTCVNDTIIHTFRAIISSNSPWWILEDLFFVNFIQALCPTYTPPSR